MVQSSKEALILFSLKRSNQSHSHEKSTIVVELELDGHFMMDSELQTSRFARKKRMPGEEAEDSRPDL